MGHLVIDERQYEALKRQAKALGVSEDELVRRAIDAALVETPTASPALDPPSPSAAREAVHWNDSEDVRLWIASLRSAAHDGLAAGEDATRPKRDRVLSRSEARRRLDAADRTITALLDAGERGASPEPHEP